MNDTESNTEPSLKVRQRVSRAASIVHRGGVYLTLGR